MLTPATAITTFINARSEAEDPRARIQMLFKKGDGINVYEEPLFIMKTYFRCIRKQATNENLDLRLQAADVIKKGRTLLHDLDMNKEEMYPKYLTPSGYWMLYVLGELTEICCLEGVLHQPPSQAEKAELQQIHET